MNKERKIVLIVAAVILLAVGIWYFASRPAANTSFTGAVVNTPNPYNLSPQDLATYNGLPSLAAQNDFITALGLVPITPSNPGAGNVQNPNPMTQVPNQPVTANTTANQALTPAGAGGTPATATATTSVWTNLGNWFKGLIAKL